MDGGGIPESAKKAGRNTFPGDDGGCSCFIYTLSGRIVKLGKLSQ